MALIFNSQVEEGFDYVPEAQKGEKKPFKVRIVPIPSVVMVKLEDGLLQRSVENELSLKTGSYNVSLCLEAVAGWDNMDDVEGNPIPLVATPKGRISEESLSMLPTGIINEIAGVIASVSQDPASIQIFAEQ